MNMQPVITNEGQKEIAKAMASAQPFYIESIHVGSGYSEDVRSVTELVDFKEKVIVADSKQIDENRAHFPALIDSKTEYPITEIGFYSSNGVLVAYACSKKIFAHKFEDQNLLLGFDLIITEFKGTLVIQGNGERLNLNLAPEIATLTNHILDCQLKNLELESRLMKIEDKK